VQSLTPSNFKNDACHFADELAQEFAGEVT
jgi:hypothetical protein